MAARAPSCERVSAITFPRRAFDPLPQHALLGCLGNLIPDPRAFFARVTFTHRFATLFAHNANTSLPIFVWNIKTLCLEEALPMVISGHCRQAWSSALGTRESDSTLGGISMDTNSDLPLQPIPHAIYFY